MKYEDVDKLNTVLKDIKLDLDKSFARRRFLKLLKPAVELISETKNELKDKYGKKTKDGKFDAINNIVQFTAENRKSLNKDLKDVLSKEITPIDFSKNIRDTMVCIEIINADIEVYKKSLNNTFTDIEAFAIETMIECVGLLEQIVRDNPEIEKQDEKK